MNFIRQHKLLVSLVGVLIGGSVCLLGITVQRKDSLGHRWIEWVVNLTMGDGFVVEIGQGYRLEATSGNMVLVRPEGVVSIGEDPYIPPKIVRLAWGERFILAKQHSLKYKHPWDSSRPSRTDSDKGVNSPVQEISNYWILDMSIPEVYGPFDESVFEKQRTVLGVPDTLVLKPVSSYRTWWE